MANFGRIHFDDLQSTRSYRPNSAYSQSKLADLLMGVRLASIAVEHDWPLLSTIAHPGFTRTNLQTAGRNLGREKPLPPIRGRRSRRRPPSRVPSRCCSRPPIRPRTRAPTTARVSGRGSSARPCASICRAAPEGVDLPASVWAIGESLTGERLTVA